MFGAAGVFGGGERYPLELARAMSHYQRTRLVVFGREAQTLVENGLEIRVLATRGHWRGQDINPISERVFGQLAAGRTIHTHHYRSVLTDSALLLGTLLRRGVFCTDHGGSARHYAARLGLERALTRFLAVSRYSAGRFPAFANRTSIIYGGVDTGRFAPGPEPRGRSVVFCGRILPHKGIATLIRSLDPATPLRIIGRAYHPAYLAELRRAAAGRDVSFHHSASDADVVAAYRTARVAVLPSVYESAYGAHPASELLGLTLMEAMACGTPVVGTRVGGIPEVIDDGSTGFVVDPDDASALRERIYQLLDSDRLWRQCSQNAIERVRLHFTWDRVARRCMEAYETRPAPSKRG
jgi:glycosyltransferase involved in cell wall biosynthesis